MLGMVLEHSPFSRDVSDGCWLHVELVDVFYREDMKSEMTSLYLVATIANCSVKFSSSSPLPCSPSQCVCGQAGSSDPRN